MVGPYLKSGQNSTQIEGFLFPVKLRKARISLIHWLCLKKGDWGLTAGRFFKSTVKSPQLLHKREFRSEHSKRLVGLYIHLHKTVLNKPEFYRSVKQSGLQGPSVFFAVIYNLVIQRNENCRRINLLNIQHLPISCFSLLTWRNIALSIQPAISIHVTSP